MKKIPDWITVGQVKKSHGVSGELLIQVLTDHQERFAAGSQLWLTRGPRERQEVEVKASRKVPQGLLVKLAGISSRDSAKELGGALLQIVAGAMSPPPAGHYYGFQLEGCEVFEGFRLVGTVVTLVESRANPYLEVDPAVGGSRILIPFVSKIIKSVDLEHERIEIIEGYLG